MHSDDINCVDWNAKNEFLIATGSNDSFVNIIDLRTRKSLYKIKIGQQPNSSILSLSFSPHSENHFAVGSDNIYIYDIVIF
jgi:WD40 repeat protein